MDLVVQVLDMNSGKSRQVDVDLLCDVGAALQPENVKM